MCISPSHVHVLRGPEWEQIPVPCKRCWRCRSNRVSSYVGRSLCEASGSEWTVSLTLTYRDRDDLAERYVTPPHFQQFVRSLRDRRHSIRYLACGEYGELKGRAHFHCILFGNGKRPEIPQERNHHHPAWPHGHLFADWRVTDRSMRYVCKYVLKDLPGGAWFSLSKKPALGWPFFKKKADNEIDLGVLPTSFEFQPPGGQRKRPYLLVGACRRDYIFRVVDGFAARRDFTPGRMSEWVRRVYEAEVLKEAKRKAELHPVAEQQAAFQEEIDRHRRKNPLQAELLSEQFASLTIQQRVDDLHQGRAEVGQP